MHSHFYQQESAMNIFKLFMVLFALIALATNGVESRCKGLWGVHRIKQPFTYNSRITNIQFVFVAVQDKRSPIFY